MWELPAVLVLALFAAGAALTVGTAAAVLTRRWWTGRPGGSLVVGVLAVGVVAFAAFVVAWLAPSLLIAFDLVVVVSSAVVLVVRREVLGGMLGHIAAGAVVFVGVLALYLGLLYAWQLDRVLFDLAAVRFSNSPLPIDNRIPYLFADRLASGESTHELVAEWNGSDRPPLLSGFILFVRGWTDAVGIGPTVSGFAASVVGQLLWIPAVASFVRAVGGSRAMSRLAVIVVATTGTTLVNTVFTWPKSISAAFVLVSAAALLLAWRRREDFPRAIPVAVVAFLLGFLAHGGAAFAAPFLVALGIMACRRQNARRLLPVGAVALLAGAVTYLPWLVYQRFVDPPGDRLLKWHLAGVIGVDDRTFPEALIDTYRDLSPLEWLAGRWANIQVAFSWNPIAGIEGGLAGRRDREFFETTAALGVAYPVLVAIVVVVLGRLLRRRLDLSDRRFALLVAGMALCVIFWIAVMVGPGSTVVHQGSQVWLLVLILAPMLWLGPRLRIAYLATQSLATLLVYALSPIPAAPLPLAIVVAVAGGALLTLSVVGVRRAGARPRMTR